MNRWKIPEALAKERKPTVAAVMRLTNGGRMGSWMGFKKRLAPHLGYGPEIDATTWDVPQEWIDAYKKAFRK